MIEKKDLGKILEVEDPNRKNSGKKERIIGEREGTEVKDAVSMRIRNCYREYLVPKGIQNKEVIP